MKPVRPWSRSTPREWPVGLRLYDNQDGTVDLGGCIDNPLTERDLALARLEGKTTGLDLGEAIRLGNAWLRWFEAQGPARKKTGRRG